MSTKILVPFFEIAHSRDKIAKIVKSRCVQIILRSTSILQCDRVKGFDLMLKLEPYRNETLD